MTRHIRDLFDPAEALMTGVVQNQDSSIGWSWSMTMIPLLPIGVHSTTARTEGRFRQHFGADGSVTPEIQSTQDDRLAY